MNTSQCLRPADQANQTAANGMRNQPSYRVRLIHQEAITPTTSQRRSLVASKRTRLMSSTPSPARNTTSVMGIDARYSRFGFNARHATTTHAAVRPLYVWRAATKNAVPAMAKQHATGMVPASPFDHN